MHVSTVIGLEHRPVCRLVMWMPDFNNGEILKEEWSYENLADMRANLANGPGTIPPQAVTMAYEGENLIAVAYPEWVHEKDDSFKSPRQIAWEKLSGDEKTRYGRRRAIAFIGMREYDPARLKVTFAGLEISPGGYADGERVVVNASEAEAKQGYLDPPAPPHVMRTIVDTNSVPTVCAKCKGPIDVGDECVYVKGIGYCPMCAGTFGPDA